MARGLILGDIQWQGDLFLVIFNGKVTNSWLYSMARGLTIGDIQWQGD